MHESRIPEAQDVLQLLQLRLFGSSLHSVACLHVYRRYRETTSKPPISPDYELGFPLMAPMQEGSALRPDRVSSFQIQASTFSGDHYICRAIEVVMSVIASLL